MSDLGLALQQVIWPFIRAENKFVLRRGVDPDPLSPTLEKAMKLLHLTPELMSFADGLINRRARFKAFLTRDFEGLSS